MADVPNVEYEGFQEIALPKEETPTVSGGFLSKISVFLVDFLNQKHLPTHQT